MVCLALRRLMPSRTVSIFIAHTIEIADFMVSLELAKAGNVTLIREEEILAAESLTRACAMPLPRSSDESALVIPATCHSLVSR